LVHREIYFKPKNSMATLAAQRTCPVAVMVVAEVDAMNSKPEEDDLMDDDTTMDDGNAENIPTPWPKLKSTIMNGPSRLGDRSHDNTKRSFRKKKWMVNATTTLHCKVGIPEFQISLFWAEEFDCKAIIC
jgi:hypothetical protein